MLILVISVFVLFLFFVFTRPSNFQYERSGFIQAPAQKIYDLVSSFKNGSKWNPYSQKDPNMKVNFIGTEGQPGFIMEFDGKKDAGAGSLELLKLVPNESVEIKLLMTKPFRAENLIFYKLTPENDGICFSWMMTGKTPFLMKFISLFIDCEKMVTKDFEIGIENLKKVVAAEK